MTPHTLTHDQQSALDAFVHFLMEPIEPVFVLSGFSGTGKSTLVKTILANLPGYMKAAHLINPSMIEYEVVLTATTNKAAEALSEASGGLASTIHSFLGLRVHTDYATRTTTLIAKNSEIQAKKLLFIDEASFIDSALLKIIFDKTSNCKIVFIGDPAQLKPVGSPNTPVFSAGFPGAHLSQVVRQAEGNPIIDLSTKFRETVSSGEFFSFKPDGVVIQHMDRPTFNQAIEAEFIRPDWGYRDSKILAWTNKSVIHYNHAVRDAVKGDPQFAQGDYAVCNKHIVIKGISFKTDQMVCITGISSDMELHGVMGKYYTLNGAVTAFGPNSLADKKAFIAHARSQEDYSLVEEAESKWVDLRALFASTIDKSQGSTFDRVFIDLDDVSRCNSGEQIARMLYVGVSRARSQVYLTGDFL